MTHKEFVTVPRPPKIVKTCQAAKVVGYKEDSGATIKSITATKKSSLKDIIQGGFSYSNLIREKNE